MKIILPEETRQELQAIQRKLEAAAKRNGKAEQTLQAQREQLEKLTGEIATLEGKLDPMDSEGIESLDKKRRQQQALETSIAKLEEDFSGNEQLHEILKNAKDPLLNAAQPMMKAMRERLVVYLAPLFDGDLVKAATAARAQEFSHLSGRIGHRINLIASYPEHSATGGKQASQIIAELLDGELPPALKNLPVVEAVQGDKKEVEGSEDSTKNIAKVSKK